MHTKRRRNKKKTHVVVRCLTENDATKIYSSLCQMYKQIITFSMRGITNDNGTHSPAHAPHRIEMKKKEKPGRVMRRNHRQNERHKMMHTTSYFVSRCRRLRFCCCQCFVRFVRSTDDCRR